MTEGPRARAGWYRDAQGELRYWDGTAWTGYTAQNYPHQSQAPSGGSGGATNGRPVRRWTRRWELWVVAAVVGFAAIGLATPSSEPDDVAEEATRSATPTPGVDPTRTPSPTPTPTPEPIADPVVLLFVADQKDGDSWVASDGEEYRLGLVNTPERNEQCGPEATAFTRKFLGRGFTVDAYATDNHGRAVAEVRDGKGRSLNVALARSGLGDGRYLDEFRHENPDLGRRLDRALASASQPACRKAAKPVPLVPQPRKTEPAKDCMRGYSPCLPIVADLDCGEIGHPVTVTGSDPYRLDRDGDGTGCD